MISIRDIENVYLMATSKFEDWRDAFEKEFYSDAMLSYLNIGINALNRLPDEVKNLSMQQNKKAWDVLNNKDNWR